MYKVIFEEEAISAIRRDGICDLLTYLHATDFYTAPASTKFHGAEEHGLVKHSLSVYEYFWKLAPTINFEKTNPNLESSAIVCLFHDICKTNFYKISNRNVKNADGKWVQVPYYTIDEELKFGAHAAKSIYLLNSFIKLTLPETMAIYHHMGGYDMSTYSKPSDAYANCKLAWLLHVADEYDSYYGGLNV